MGKWSWKRVGYLRCLIGVKLFLIWQKSSLQSYFCNFILLFIYVNFSDRNNTYVIHGLHNGKVYGFAFSARSKHLIKNLHNLQNFRCRGRRWQSLHRCWLERSNWSERCIHNNGQFSYVLLLCGAPSICIPITYFCLIERVFRTLHNNLLSIRNLLNHAQSVPVFNWVSLTDNCFASHTVTHNKSS
jgi:hypothetical protein